MTPQQKLALLKQLFPGLQFDLSTIDLKVEFKLEKFDGDYVGQEPIEVIEGGDDRETVVTRSR